MRNKHLCLPPSHPVLLLCSSNCAFLPLIVPVPCPADRLGSQVLSFRDGFRLLSQLPVLLSFFGCLRRSARVQPAFTMFGRDNGDR